MITLLILFNSCFNPETARTSETGRTDSTGPSQPAVIGYTVHASYPHDTAYFTEGLEYYQGKLWESSGGNITESPYPSALGVVNTQTGRNDPRVLMDRGKYFAEGITFFRDKLYWLTLDNGIGFVYDAQDFKQLRSFKLPSIEKKGWGLTHDSSHIIMSDGTDRLYYLHPDSLTLVKKISVRDNRGPVNNLNELEYVNGKIYANRWLTSYILVVDPATGYVTGTIDLALLQKEADRKMPGYRELNGIAWNAATGRMMITGKRWSEMYEIILHQ
ncbi:MAG TPA: glutaminyl-peptide cyclotransferase [Pseudobacter sp.]|nr:glutaminyl-peptide cyclotransferase [Pseudobacter sp.]